MDYSQDATCPVCGDPVDPDSSHIVIGGNGQPRPIHAYCVQQHG
jgi:hypothetical protein